MRLQVITAVAAWAVTSACQSLPVTRNLWSRDVDFKALSEKLSSTAKVYYPGSNEFEEASSRWSNLEIPTVNIVVVPSTENDVVETVSFCILYLVDLSLSLFHIFLSICHVFPAHGQRILVAPMHPGDTAAVR
jgi:hypothetical protein